MSEEIITELKATDISQDKLLRFLKDSIEINSSIHCGFILGAGASVKSGIPSGSNLAKKWFDEIEEDSKDKELKEWIKKEKIVKWNLAESYTKIFAKRFNVDYRAGYEELQRYMDKAEPSIGYSFLAQFLSKTSHKFVITTNFDTMVEDALFGLKEAKPLVLGHELLSKYINPTSPTRPTIIKIHRDFLLDPYNTDESINKIDEEWAKALKPLLKEHSIIVIGYGGNDDSLMDYLTTIENRKPIYWCYRGDKDKLSSKIKGLLTEKDFIVEISGFDKFMLLLNDKLNLGTIVDKEDLNNSPIVKNAIKYAKKYNEQLKELAVENLDSDEQKAIENLLPSWWHYELKVKEESDDIKKEMIYNDGLNAYPKSHELMNNYANLLKKLKKYKEAETYYEKALDIEPNDADYNGNYAILLKKLNRDDKAETYYKKALDIGPNNADLNGNYAQFLLTQGKNKNAEVYIQNAFKNSTEENDLIIELWFYRLAHYPVYYDEAIKELNLLLNKGIQSIAWDFSKNIEQARKENHKNIELLEEYAQKITTPYLKQK